MNGASYCKRLQPGRRFELQEHEIAALDGHYVVTRVEHEGYSAEALPQGRARYQNRFVCAPAVVPLRPRVPRKPRATAETGIVVGPPGQEIHTDDLGRVRVRFFWDLSGRSGDQGTCWLRVAQLWAGAGWGSQFVPRVGMEVLVTYLNGDPDRPIVTGCIYNATHPVPFALPANAIVAMRAFTAQVELIHMLVQVARDPETRDVVFRENDHYLSGAMRVKGADKILNEALYVFVLMGARADWHALPTVRERLHA